MNFDFICFGFQFVWCQADHGRSDGTGQCQPDNREELRAGRLGPRQRATTAPRHGRRQRHVQQLHGPCDKSQRGQRRDGPDPSHNPGCSMWTTTAHHHLIGHLYTTEVSDII